MAYIHIPGVKRYRCAICGEPTDQLHHLSYNRRLEYDDRFDRRPLCEGHHRDLHRLHDSLGRKVTLELFSAWYIHNPVLTVQQVHAIRPAPLQLNFGQQNTPQGEYWQQWEALFLEFEPEWRQDEAA